MTLDDAWLDRTAYPFSSHYLELDVGRMHYVDEGEGPPVVMLHGNPTWSFMYRHLIHDLSPQYRCVAPDYLGFGLSDKPPDWSYLPAAHARHVETLIERLGLKDLTLVVHDWGGPIGLSYALRHPENVKRLVILNTWIWPRDDERFFSFFSKAMGGPLGRWLVNRFNFFARIIMPMAFGDRSTFPAQVRRHYRRPLERPEARKGSWVFPRELLGSSDWLHALWDKRHAIADKPAFLVWGMQDRAFRERELQQWLDLFTTSRVHRLESVGHYVAEEAGSALPPRVASFLDDTA